MDTDKTGDPHVANKGSIRCVQLSEIKTKTDQAFIESERRNDFQVSKMAEKGNIDAIEMNALEGLHETVRSTQSLHICSVVGEVYNERVMADHIHKAAANTVVHLDTINFVPDALLKNDEFIAQIATFVSNYVKKKS